MANVIIRKKKNLSSSIYFTSMIEKCILDDRIFFLSNNHICHEDLNLYLSEVMVKHFSCALRTVSNGKNRNENDSSPKKSVQYTNKCL